MYSSGKKCTFPVLAFANTEQPVSPVCLKAIYFSLFRFLSQLILLKNPNDVLIAD